MEREEAVIPSACRHTPTSVPLAPILDFY
ncbi:unnamed protein product [Ectocarpus sp. CCAP 1310/34]|nr:unnamed protein product [Ectocarpus sp. CCAP 1310/34]